MADYSETSAVHETLTANEVDSVTLSKAGTGFLGKPQITVVNRTGSAEIYFTVSTSSTQPAEPAVGGKNTFVLPGSIGSVSVPAADGNVVVKLISTGAEAYSVEAL